MTSKTSAQLSEDQDIGADSYMVDQVRRQIVESDAVISDLDIPQQLKAMRSEIKDISYSLSVLADRARSIAARAPTALEGEIKSLVSDRPIAMVLGTVAVSFSLTSLLIYKFNRS